MANSRRELKPPKALTIDPALLAEFSALRDNAPGRSGRQWTEQEDTLLLMFWPWRDKGDVAEKIGCNETTARARYRKLLQEQPARAAELAEQGRKLCSGSG